MADLINLRQFRKLKQRQEKQKAADNNRRQFGISKKLKDQAKADQSMKVAKLDGHRIDRPKND